MLSSSNLDFTERDLGTSFSRGIVETLETTNPKIDTLFQTEKAKTLYCTAHTSCSTNYFREYNQAVDSQPTCHENLLRSFSLQPKNCIQLFS